LNPTVRIVLNVSTASEAIEAYKAILAAQSSASVTLSSREERQDAEDMKRFNQALASKVQSSGCSSAPRVSEEQTLREEYRKLRISEQYPQGKGFRLTKEQIASGAKFNSLDPVQVDRAMKLLRDAVEQLRDGTFIVTQEDSEPQVGENHPDTGEYF
jgi:hypothetical protein